MKVAYVSIHSAEDPNTWSGLNKSIADCLRAQDLEVTLIGPLYNARRALQSKIRAKLRQGFSGERYLWTRDLSLLRAYGQDLAAQLNQLEFDVIFSPGTEAIACLPKEVRTPVVFWTDAPFGPLVNYYAWYTGLAARCVSESMECDNLALQRATLACYSSDWAAAAAINMHGAAREKVAVIPFGPNLDSGVTEAEIPDLILQRLRSPWRFLFVGVDWVRKGADRAVAVVSELNRLGFPSELHVVGCPPPADRATLPSFVKLHGFINRRDEAGRRQLVKLFRDATFFILPSLAEAFGVVFCEAAAHALPMLAARTGGIPTAMHDGASGRLFDFEATVADYVEYILKNVKPANYEARSRAALEDSLSRLNWQASGARIKALLEMVVSPQRPLQNVH